MANGIEFDNRTNLLKENVYQYSLQDVNEGNYFREMFEYTTLPKVAFNHRNVPMNMPDQIWLTDTTFRDGQQSRSPFTVKQIVDSLQAHVQAGRPQGHYPPERVLSLHGSRPGSH